MSWSELFHRADKLVSKPDDMLSEQKQLRQSLNQCGYKSSMIYHAIRLSKHHNTKTATSIQKNICHSTLQYYGELSDNMKRIFQDYDISMQLAIPANTLRNSLAHPKDKHKK